jgi:hypothetical protein
VRRGAEEARKGAEGSAEGGWEGSGGERRGCTRGCAATRLVLARRARLRALVRPVDHLVEVELLLGALHDALLDRAARHQPVQVHHLGLTDAVHARHRLQIDLRVPVGVEEDAADAIGQARGQPIYRGGGPRRRAAGGGRQAAGGGRRAAATHQVSAVWQLMPRPPARVDMRKTNLDEPGMLKELMSTVRCTRLVLPSSRQYLYS